MKKKYINQLVFLNCLNSLISFGIFVLLALIFPAKIKLILVLMLIFLAIGALVVAKTIAKKSKNDPS